MFHPVSFSGFFNSKPETETSLSRIERWKSSFLQSQIARVGLKNSGNMCYMNCIIQVLFETKSFRETIFRFEILRTKQPVFHAIQELFLLMKDSKNSVISAEHLLHLTDSGYGQQDSSEFLMRLFQILHKEELDYRLQVSKRMNGDKVNGLDAHQPISGQKIQHENGVQETLVPQSIIQQIFGGILQTCVECLECGQVTSQRDFFTELPVSLPDTSAGALRNPHRIEELLYETFSSEKLSDENCYYCDECQSLQEGVRTQQLISSPRNLILILNRFRFNVRLRKLEKLMHKIHYSEVLELPVATKPSSVVKYKLYAAVVHVGTDVQSGHYYILVKSGKGGWLKMDDEIISKSNLKKVNMLNSPETPYMLFYSAFSDSEHPSNQRSCSKLFSRKPSGKVGFCNLSIPSQKCSENKIMEYPSVPSKEKVNLPYQDSNMKKEDTIAELNKKRNLTIKKPLRSVAEFFKCIYKMKFK